MTSSANRPAFPELPVCGVMFPNSAFLLDALEYTKQHTSVETVNHCLRSAAFALVCMRKVPHLEQADEDLVVFSCLMHDLGWATTASLISKDKRFEVDGANAARAWLHEHSDQVRWDARQVQISWDAIALHTIPSVGQHKESEVAVTGLGILADFLGPDMPNGIITVAEYTEVITLFPRLGLHDHIVNILCGLCKTKPETTYDNVVGQFGIAYGLDGKGEGKEGFEKKVSANMMVNTAMPALKACEEQYR